MVFVDGWRLLFFSVGVWFINKKVDSWPSTSGIASDKQIKKSNVGRGGYIFVWITNLL